MTTRLVSVVIGASLVLLLGACGASASSSTSSASSTATTQSIALEAQDFQFSPTTLAVSPNTTVNVTVKNTGARQHNLTIKELGVNQDLAPGSTKTLTFSTQGAATLVYYCEYHRDTKGMKGTLTVGSGAGAGSGTTSPAPAATSSSSNVPY